MSINTLLVAAVTIICLPLNTVKYVFQAGALEIYEWKTGKLKRYFKFS